MSDELLQAMGWLALGLNVWGNLALAKKGTVGWLIRLACNFAWVVYSFSFGVWPLLANHVLFAGINVYGWREWSKTMHICYSCKREIDLKTYKGTMCFCGAGIKR